MIPAMVIMMSRVDVQLDSTFVDVEGIRSEALPATLRWHFMVLIRRVPSGYK
jgi:hypothetical protein